MTMRSAMINRIVWDAMLMTHFFLWLFFRLLLNLHI